MPESDISGTARSGRNEVRVGVIHVHVVLVSSSYDPYTGGVEEHVRQVARVLAARGHSIEVWTVDRGEHLRRRTVDGITVRYLPTPLPARSPRDVLAFARHAPGAARRWRGALRDFAREHGSRPDLLHVQCFGPNGVYALGMHRLTRTPLVVSSHGETFADDHHVFDASRLVPWALGAAMHRALAVTGCSGVVLDDLARRFPRWDRRAASTVPNGVDLAAVDVPHDSRPPAPGREDAAPVVLAVGRLQHVKGFDLLVRAFADAASDALLPAGTRLRIGGDGPEEQTLRELAATLGIADRVDLPGRLDRRRVAAEMSRAAVVVVPSRAESFGITVLEAWRAGAPVVATTRGGPPEFVTPDETGLLVDPLDTVALSSALVRLLADPGLRERLGTAGRAIVESTYTWDRVADRYEALYARARPHRAR